MPTSSSCARVIRTLAKRYTAKPDMDLGNPKDTLLGVLLSARTRDANVLKIFSAFTKRFPTFTALAASSPSEIAKSISSIGLYRTKAKAIHGLSKMIVERHGGRVPRTLEELLRLPGIGRKSANCALSYIYGVPAICVDTHVFRITHRLGWSRGKTPERVERDLQTLIPKSLWSEINRTLIHFGRDICVPRIPKCWKCPVAQWCEYPQKTKSPR